MNSDFESMVEKYSQDLLQSHRQWREQGIIKADADLSLPEAAPDTEELYAAPKEPESDAEIQTEDSEDTSFAVDDEKAAKNPDDTALFYARVFAGESAYPLKGAKVVLRKDGQLISFTVSDKNGETPRVRIPAFAKENSLEPFSENQSLEYFADVYMKGFITKKDLPVSAVGGSVIVLDVQMTPVSERID